MVLLCLGVCFFLSCSQKENSEIAFNRLMTWSRESSLPAEYGLAGAYAGYHNNAVIFAGGCHFATDRWRSDAVKIYTDDIYVLTEEDNVRLWKKQDIRLPHPVAYGASVTVPDGVLCFGGMNSETVFDLVLLLKWNSKTQTVEVIELGKMPTALANMQAALHGKDIYLIGGQTAPNVMETTTAAFLKGRYTNTSSPLTWIDVRSTDAEGNEYLNQMPADPRILAAATTQFNGESESIYVIGGRQELGNNQFVFFSDTWEFNPTKSLWIRKADAPVPLMAASAVSVGMAHIFVLNGAQGDLLTQLVNGELTQQAHPGFHKESYA